MLRFTMMITMDHDTANLFFFSWIVFIRDDLFTET